MGINQDDPGPNVPLLPLLSRQTHLASLAGKHSGCASLTLEEIFAPLVFVLACCHTCGICVLGVCGHRSFLYPQLRGIGKQAMELLEAILGIAGFYWII